MVIPPEEMRTERLLLRRPVRADARAVFEAYAADPEVTRWLPWPPARSAAEVADRLEESLRGWEEGRIFSWSILLARSGELLGSVEARLDDWMMNVNYVIARPHWNCGYATEAVREITAWADREPGIFRVWAVCAVDNPASARVLEKAGMVREGVLRRWAVFPNLGGTPQDCCCYARVRPGGHGT